MNWTRGYKVTYEFWEVDPSTLGDVSRITDVLSAKMSWDASKASQGSATITLDHDPGEAWWRCYLVAEQGGERYKAALGTWCCVRTPDSFDGKAHSMEVDCTSPLNEAAETHVAVGHTVAKGSDAVAAAVKTAQAGCRCPIAAGGSFALESDMTFDGDCRIDAAKALLDAAGCHFELDGHGRAVTAADADPDASTPQWWFSDSDGSILLPEATDDRKLADVPNRVVVVSSASGRAPVTGVAVNDDPASETSTVARGRVVEAVEENPDGLSDSPSADECAAMAKRLLRQKSRVAREVTVSHGWVPVGLHRCAGVNYRRMGLRTTGIITKQEINIGTELTVTDTLSRYVDYWRG